MLIGILSDTHGRADAMAAAMDVLRRAGAEFFIHCGDVGSEEVLDHLAGEAATFVWGNTDWDRGTLGRYAEHLKIRCHGDFADLTLDGKAIAVMHGDNYALRERVLSEQNHDYLFQGHTHIAEDRRVGRTRHINPGALFRASTKTVALLDLATDTLKFLTVDVPTGHRR